MSRDRYQTVIEYKGYTAGPIDFSPETNTSALRAAAEGVSLSQWIARQIESAP